MRIALPVFLPHSYLLFCWFLSFSELQGKGHEGPYSLRSTEHVAEWYSIDLEGQMKCSIQNNPFIELEIYFKVKKKPEVFLA